MLIADDHARVRSGLRALLSAQPDLEVVGEAEDGVAVVEQCRQLRLDVVLRDLTMPVRDRTLAAEEINCESPAVKI